MTTEPDPTASDAAAPEGLAAFAGKRVHVAGAFAVLHGDQIKDRLRDVGSRIETHLSRKTNLVVHGAYAEAELERARALRVRLMSETTVLRTLRAAGELPDRLLTALRAREPLPFAKEAPRVHRQNPDPAAALREGAAIRAAHGEKYGLTVPQLLRCWIRVFSRRPDVHVLHDTAGRPVGAADLDALALRLPAHALAVAAELGPLHFCWIFADRRGGAGARELGCDGGRLNLVGFASPRWYAEDERHEAMLDELQPEGSAFLGHSLDESIADAQVYFRSVSAGARELGSVAGYLQSGAARAFVWYWPHRSSADTDALLARLTAASLPATTPAEEVVAGLQARGLEPAEARGLQRWLGADAVLLLPA